MSRTITLDRAAANRELERKRQFDESVGAVRACAALLVVWAIVAAIDMTMSPWSIAAVLVLHLWRSWRNRWWVPSTYGDD